jgi:hypothetical protein
MTIDESMETSGTLGGTLQLSPKRPERERQRHRATIKQILEKIQRCEKKKMSKLCVKK